MLLFGNLDLNYLIAAGFVLLFGMGWHEYAHAVMADWWGDPTPRQNGKLTPNPIEHISWIGWAMFLFLGFGVLGSVAVNPRRMRDPRWGNFWTSAAGPLSNLAQALVFAIVLHLFSNVVVGTSAIEAMALRGSAALSSLESFLLLFFLVGIQFNALLFVFNLIPFVLPGFFMPGVPYMPMDGWQMLYSLLPGTFLDHRDVPQFVRQNIPPLSRFLQHPAQTWAEWGQPLSYAFLIILLAGFVLPPQYDPLWLLIGSPTSSLTRFLILLG